MDQRAHALGEGRARRAGVEQRRHGHRGAEDDAPGRHLQPLEGLREQAHDLGLRRDAVTGHELDAELRKLARLAAQRRLLADHRGAVAQADGQVGLAHAAGDEARRRQREVGSQREEGLVGVEELEGAVLYPAAPLERGPLLQKRRLHREVAVLREAPTHHVRDALAGERLPRENVPEATGRCCRHVRSLPAESLAFRAPSL